MENSQITLKALQKKAVMLVNKHKQLTATQLTLFKEAMSAAQKATVSIKDKEQAVFFSVSKQPTKENLIKAEAYTAQNPKAFMQPQTDAGKHLISMNLFEKLPYDIACVPWEIASFRYANNAKGNVHAEWHNAHPESTSMLIEAPVLIANKKVTSINNINKIEFIKNIIASRAPESFAYILKEAQILEKKTAPNSFKQKILDIGR